MDQNYNPDYEAYMKISKQRDYITKVKKEIERLDLEYKVTLLQLCSREENRLYKEMEAYFDCE